MMGIIRILLATSIALWGTSASSNSYELESSELNLGDGASDAYTYWNTFFCQLYPGDPACASSAPNPYFGPAWYNFNYGGWGFEPGRHHEHKAHDKKRKHHGCNKCNKHRNHDRHGGR